MIPSNFVPISYRLKDEMRRLQNRFSNYYLENDFIEKDYVGLANWIYPPEYYSLGVEKLSSSMDIYHAALVLFSILSDEKLEESAKNYVEYLKELAK